MPLLLCKSGVQSAILQIISQHSNIVSTEYLYWLDSEFNELVSSATQEVAAMSEGSTATSFDEWDYMQEGTSFLSRGHIRREEVCRKERPGLKRQLDWPSMESKEVRQRKRIKTKSQSFFFDVTVGRIQIIVPRQSTVSNRETSPDQVSQVSFSFSPKPEICPTFLATKFIRILNEKLEPQLYAQLNTFVMSEFTNFHHDLFLHGTVESLDNALKTGQISPYEVEKANGNICFYVRDSPSQLVT